MGIPESSIAYNANNPAEKTNIDVEKMSFDGVCSDFFGQPRLCCILSHHINEIWAKSLLSIVKSVAMYEAQFRVHRSHF